MHKSLEELKGKLCDELDEIARKEDMSAGDLDAVHKLTDTIKNIDKICMLEDDDYSGSSYANRRGTHHVRGHYSHDDDRNDMRGGRGVSRGRYSRDGAKDYMIEQLEEMLENTDNEKVRNAIQRCMATMENA